MSRFRKEVRDDFTVVHNDFIRDKRLGYAEKGLLLTLMQLPDDGSWNYSIAGLAELTPDGTYKVSVLLKKLKATGYFRRIRVIDTKGRVVDWIYEFSDQVHEEWINSDDNFTEPEEKGKSDIPPQCENPHVGYPHMDERPQSNKKKSNIKDIDSDHHEQTNNVNLTVSQAEAEKGIKENIQYERLCSEYGENIISPVARVITETMISNKNMLKVNKRKVPKREVQAKLALLRYEHICQLIKNIQNTNPNPKYFNAYMLTSLYNLVAKEEKLHSPQSSANNFFDAIKERVNDISEHSYNLDLLMQYAMEHTPKLRPC